MTEQNRERERGSRRLVVPSLVDVAVDSRSVSVDVAVDVDVDVDVDDVDVAVR